MTVMPPVGEYLRQPALYVTFGYPCYQAPLVTHHSNLQRAVHEVPPSKSPQAQELRHEGCP